MSKETLIKRIKSDCPICGKHHEVYEKCRLTNTVVKGKTVQYIHRFYFCSNSSEEENEYETSSMVNENILSAINAYRTQNGLLTSEEIVALRKEYSLSQVDLARLLGWGEATISRYESKAIQDEAYDIVLRQLKDSPYVVFEYYKKNQSSFSLNKQLEIKKMIDEKMESYGREVSTRQALSSEYVRFDTPSDFNGYKSLDIDKIEAIVSYYAKNIRNLYKVKLMKMLWYADVLCYKNYGLSMTGLVYQHKELGALPVGHNKILSLERINVQEESSPNYDVLMHFYPVDTMDYSVISKDEMFILDKVIKKFNRFSTQQLVDYMHKENAYVMTKNEELIPYSISKDINDF